MHKAGQEPRSYKNICVPYELQLVHAEAHPIATATPISMGGRNVFLHLSCFAGALLPVR